MNHFKQFPTLSHARTGHIHLALWLTIALMALVLSACGGGTQLTYRAGGTASGATVTYMDSTGNLQKETVSLPWEKTIKMSGNPLEFQLIVANTTSSGDVSCEILLDEKALSKPSTSAAYLDCSGSMTKEGNGISYDLSVQSVESILSKANKEYEDKDYEAAQAEIDRALELAPNSGDAYFLQGLVQEATEDYDQALQSYSKAIELNPNDKGAYNNRGLLYQKMNNAVSALEDWTRAIAIDPNYEKAYYNRAQVYFAVKNYNAAQADVLKVQELSDDP